MSNNFKVGDKVCVINEEIIERGRSNPNSWESKSLGIMTIQGICGCKDSYTVEENAFHYSEEWLALVTDKPKYPWRK